MIVNNETPALAFGILLRSNVIIVGVPAVRILL
jgi:hypothetical protein